MATAYLEIGATDLGRKPLVARLFEDLSVAWRLFESAIKVSRAIESIPPTRQRDLVLNNWLRETI